MVRRLTRRRGSFASGEGPQGEPLDAAAISVPLGEEGHAADLARIAEPALASALEAIPSPAFVVRFPATILHGNVRGRTLFANEKDRVIALLRGPASPLKGPVRFPIGSAPDHAVVVIQDPEGDARTRLAAVTQRWGLTPRQSAVLALVAQGDSNRSVAVRLGCSEKTVELHVSALLAKTHRANRSQLVAGFWTDLA